MKLTLEGIGPDISVERDHVEHGLRRAKFDILTEDGIHEGAGSASISVIISLADTADLQSAEKDARRAAARFLRKAADTLDDE